MLKFLACLRRNDLSSYFCPPPSSILQNYDEEDTVIIPVSSDRESENTFLLFKPTREQQCSLETFLGKCKKCPSCGFVYLQSSNICMFCHQYLNLIEHQRSEVQPSTSSYQPHVQDEVQRHQNKFSEIKLDWSKLIKKIVEDEEGCSIAISPKIEKYTDIYWCRLDEIDLEVATKLQWTIFPNPIKPSDIIQGISGDCWIASALASLAATKPDLIYCLILNTKYDEVGIYALQIYIDGRWQLIVINDMLPCDEKGDVAFGQVKNQHLFFAFIEKAFAKSRGSYQALEGGTPAEALNMMTGFPCSTLKIPHSGSNESANLSLLNEIWIKIMKSKKMGFPMAARSIKENKGKLKEALLTSSHGWSIVNTLELEVDSRIVKLLKLYNPSACSSWNGDWSDHSKLWSLYPNLRRRLNPSLDLSKEGMFWISFDDFSNYFVRIDICKARDNWIIVHKHGIFPESYAEVVKGFVLIVNEPTEIDLNLFQRLPKNPLSTRHPVDACVAIYLAHENEDRRLYRGALVASSKRQVSKQLSCECSLIPGKYIVIPLAFNHRPTDRSQNVHTTPVRYVLALHSSCRVSLDPHTVDLPSSDQNWSGAITELVMKKGKMKINEEKNTRHYALNDEGVILVFENHSPHETTLVKCVPSKSENLGSSRCLAENVCRSYFIDAVPPLHRMLVAIVGKLDRNQPFTANYDIIVDTVPGNTDLRKWNLRGQYHVPALASADDLHEPRPFNLFN